jgi:5-(carboxyamino)imidazole ribonucleotide synthase
MMKCSKQGAPRPRSGHYSIRASYTSQFENHIRAILNLPLGEILTSKVAGIAGKNLVGFGDLYRRFSL